LARGGEVGHAAREGAGVGAGAGAGTREVEEREAAVEEDLGGVEDVCEAELGVVAVDEWCAGGGVNGAGRGALWSWSWLEKKGERRVAVMRESRDMRHRESEMVL
jgi:hypothetical protein